MDKADRNEIRRICTLCLSFALDPTDEKLKAKVFKLLEQEMV